MEKNTFHEHLVRATRRAFDFARKFVHNPLPESFAYLVHLNQSYDGNPLKPGERVFPHDVERHGRCVGTLELEQVVELLWRDGFVPEWINISVVRADERHSFIQLVCCGRFTDRDELLYYSQTDDYPFGVKGPILPPNWKHGDTPFDLHWWQEP